MWSVTKALRIPLDTRVENLFDLPYTIGYVIRKRIQVDNLSELPKEKQPTDKTIWDGTSEELDDWLDKVLYKNIKPNLDFEIDTREIE